MSKLVNKISALVEFPNVDTPIGKFITCAILILFIYYKTLKVSDATKLLL